MTMQVVQLLAVLSLLSPLAMAVKKCYSMDGQVLPDTHYPCNPDADVSACCALNGTSPDNDICLSTGLCQSTAAGFAGFIYADGCTDSTGQAAACPHICDSQPQQYNFNVLQCQPGQFCCRAGYDTSNCCADQSKLVNTSHVGTLLTNSGKAINTTFDPNADGASSGTCKSSTSVGAVAGALGGVLGTLLIAAIVGLVLLLRRNARTRKELASTQKQFTQLMHERQLHEAKMENAHVPPYQAHTPGSGGHGHGYPAPMQHSYSSGTTGSNGHGHGGQMTSEIGSPETRPVEMDGHRGLSELSN